LTGLPQVGRSTFTCRHNQQTTDNAFFQLNGWVSIYGRPRSAEIRHTLVKLSERASAKDA
jgi:hypothetical protein